MVERALVLALVVMASGVGSAIGQQITIRTVPISQSHQFDLFPSRTQAMGGLAIAVDDSLYDPFSNPAKGARFASSRGFSAPGLYRVSAGAGAGRTLPVGALVRSGNWFGGAAVAIQQVDLSQPSIFALQVPDPCITCVNRGVELPAANRSNGNAYGQALLGRVFPASGLAIGASVFWADLNGVDGVDLLYAGSARLKQYGHAMDLRIGALKELAGDRSFSALLLHNRYATTHDVYYIDPFWDPGAQQFAQRPRLEQNLDHTNTWGLHLQYSQPLRNTGWKLGWIATTNIMSHPKIPNYEIQNIPRDPGNSEAFNFGVGISKSVQAATVGLDVVYEPIWSYTWADQAGPVQAANGTTIAAGGKTIENRFRFSNAIVRMGFAQDIAIDQSAKAFGFQLGLSVHRIDYHLAQRDNVQLTSRRLQEDWVEWTPTWGASLRFPAWELRYRGSVTNGTGRPGVFAGDVTAVDAPRLGNILVAPSGPLSLSGVRVMAHQVSISFPFK